MHGTLYVSMTRWGYFDRYGAEPNVAEVWQIGSDEPLASMPLDPYAMVLGMGLAPTKSCMRPFSTSATVVCRVSTGSAKGP